MSGFGQNGSRLLYVNTYLDGRMQSAIRGEYPKSHLWGYGELLKSFPTSTVYDRHSSAASRFFERVAHRIFGLSGDWLLSAYLLRHRHQFDHIYFANGNPVWEIIPASIARRAVAWIYTPRQARAVAASPARFVRTWICLTRATEVAVGHPPGGNSARFVSWCADEKMFTPTSHTGDFFLACGRTNRNIDLILQMARQVDYPFKLLVPQNEIRSLGSIPANVEIIDGPPDAATDLGCSYAELVNEFYGRARAVIIALRDDPEDTAGYTNLLETMACGRPVIMSRTGCLDVDLDALGCGYRIPNGEPNRWRDVLLAWATNPGEAAAIGAAGRMAVESHYNLDRFGRDVVEVLAGSGKSDTFRE